MHIFVFVVVDYMVYDDRQYLHNGIMSVAIWICGRTIKKPWRSKTYIMCVCLFSVLSRKVGALQISIIIIIIVILLLVGLPSADT